jgi:hypothetical protein
MIQSVDRLPFETITHGALPLPSLSCKRERK